MEQGKVLVVDDAPEMPSFLSVILTKRGIIFRTYTEAESAILDPELSTYEIALLDRNLPRMSGEELASWMRDSGISARIILMTSDQDFILVKAVDRVLIKPFTPAEILSLLQNIV